MQNKKGNILIIILTSLFLTGILLGQFLNFTDWSLKEDTSSTYLSQVQSQDSSIAAALSNYLSDRSFCSRSLRESQVRVAFNTSGVKNIREVKHNPTIKLSGKQASEGWNVFEVYKGAQFGDTEVDSLDFSFDRTAKFDNFTTQIRLDMGLKKRGQSSIIPASFAINVSLGQCAANQKECEVISCYGVGGFSSCPDGNIVFSQKDKNQDKPFLCSNDLGYNIAMYHHERVMPCYEVTNASSVQLEPLNPFKSAYFNVEVEKNLDLDKKIIKKPCATMVTNLDDSNYNIKGVSGEIRPVTQKNAYIYENRSGVANLKTFSGFKAQGHLVDKLTYKPRFSGKLDVKVYVPIVFYQGKPERAFSANLFVREQCSQGDDFCDDEMKQIGVADICNPFSHYPVSQTDIIGCWGLVWGDYEVQKGKTYEIYLTAGSQDNRRWGPYKFLAGTVKMSTIYMEGVWDITEYTAPINVQ